MRNKVTSNSSLGWISWIWIFKLTTVLLVLGVVALIYIDAQIRHRFEGHRWSLPAKVYARPLELFTGQQLAQGQLKFELTQLGYRWVTQAKAPGQVQKTNQGMIIYSRGFRFVGGDEQGHLAVGSRAALKAHGCAYTPRLGGRYSHRVLCLEDRRIPMSLLHIDAPSALMLMASHSGFKTTGPTPAVLTEYSNCRGLGPPLS